MTAWPLPEVLPLTCLQASLRCWTPSVAQNAKLDLFLTSVIWQVFLHFSIPHIWAWAQTVGTRVLTAFYGKAVNEVWTYLLSWHNRNKKTSKQENIVSSVREWWWPQVSPSPRGVTSLPGCPLLPVMSGITVLTSVLGQALCNLWDSKSSLDLPGFWRSRQWVRRHWIPYPWLTFPLSLCKLRTLIFYLCPVSMIN